MKLLSKSFVALAFACLGTILFSISAHATVELAFEGAGNLFEKGSDSMLRFGPDATKSTLATETRVAELEKRLQGR